MLENSCDLKKSRTGNPLITTGCGGATPAILLSAQIHPGLQLVESRKGEGGGEGRRGLEAASEMKGTGLNLAKTESDNITSSFIATRTNPFPSHCMTHAEGRMEPI